MREAFIGLSHKLCTKLPVIMISWIILVTLLASECLSEAKRISVPDFPPKLPKRTQGYVRKPRSFQCTATATGQPGGNAVSTRTPFVTPTCPAGLIPKNCSCQGTCRDPDGCENNCTGGMTCGCNDGLLMGINACVPKCQCECYLQENVEHSVLDIACSSDASCKVINGTPQCICKDGFYGDGIECSNNCLKLHSLGYIKPCKDANTCSNDTLLCYCPSRGSNATCGVAGDCKDIFDAGHTENGIYYINPQDWLKAPFKVYCDMTNGGGWTVFQRRSSQSLYQFNRTWNDYKNGFYNSNESFWLGNEKLYLLTNQTSYVLRISIKQAEVAITRTDYRSFRIKSEDDMYELELSDCGDAGRLALLNHANGTFSTYDRNNDGNNCGHIRQSGWWYKTEDCGDADLNQNDFFVVNPTIKYTEMKMKPITNKK